MKSLWTGCCFTATAIAFLLIPEAVVGQKKKEYVAVPILVAWFGQIEPELAKAAPSGPILSDAAWKELWRSWRKGEDPPYIDFDNAMVLAACNNDFNRIAMGTSVDGEGDLRIVLKSTLLAGELKTRGYLIAVVSRKGIKSVQGVPLEKK